MTEHLLSTLGLALRAGAVAVGEEPVGAAAEALDLKAKRARERKEEQLQHEKNLRQGRHRVHGGKPPEPPHASPEPPAPEHRPPAPEHRRPPRREHPEGRPDRVYKERSGRPPRDKRPAKKEAPGARYENARPVKKGKGSRKTTGR